MKTFKMTMMIIMMIMMMTSCSVVVGEDVKNYTVQVRVMLDKKGQELWKSKSGMTSETQLREELMSYFVDLTDTYESLVSKANIRIKFEVESITLMDENIFKPYHLKKDNSIKYFRDWQLPKYYKSPVDMTVLFTGFHLYDAEAWGQTDAICTAQSVAVCQFEAQPRDIQVLAHEIGHILGSPHDYGTQPHDDCVLDSGKIMNPNIELSPKRTNYEFSSCSADYIKFKIDNLDREKNNCMTDNSDVEITGRRYGELVTLDNICSRKFGKKAFALTSYYHQYPDPDDLCLFLHCSQRDWKPTQRSYMRFPQGTRCGKNKQCIRGRCVETDTGSAMISDTCPFGDQKMIPYEGYFLDTECRYIELSQCPSDRHDCCNTCDPNNPYRNKTADDVCAENFGEGWVLKRYAYTPTTYKEKMCSELDCVKYFPDKGRVTQTLTTVPDELACGRDMRCSRGKCVDVYNNRTPKSVKTHCPWGDQDLKALGFPITCQSVNVSACPKSQKLACCATFRR